MNSRTLVLVVGGFFLLGAVAMFALSPSSEPEGEPVVAVRAPRPPAPPATSDYIPPDVNKPLPPRASPALAERRRNREGVRPGSPPHDFDQDYEPTAASIKEGLEARAHRFAACTDVFGMPTARVEVAGGDPPEGLPLTAVVAPAGGRGVVTVHVPGSPPDLESCLQEASADMNVLDPGEEFVTTSIEIPIAPDEPADTGAAN